MVCQDLGAVSLGSSVIGGPLFAFSRWSSSPIPPPPFPTPPYSGKGGSECMGLYQLKLALLMKPCEVLVSYYTIAYAPTEHLSVWTVCNVSSYFLSPHRIWVCCCYRKKRSVTFCPYKTSCWRQENSSMVLITLRWACASLPIFLALSVVCKYSVRPIAPDRDLHFIPAECHAFCGQLHRKCAYIRILVSSP